MSTLQVRVFNTGRLYQRDGQWIGYAKLASMAPDFRTHIVAFCDYSRMVDGVVTIRGDVTDGAMLAAYDAGGYGAAECEIKRELETATRAGIVTRQAEAEAAKQERARAYRDRVRATDTAHACKHGHGDCAAFDGGPCVDEVMSEAGL